MSKEILNDKVIKLLDAAYWNFAPYLDEYTRDQIEDENPHIYELITTYEALTGDTII